MRARFALLLVFAAWLAASAALGQAPVVEEETESAEIAPIVLGIENEDLMGKTVREIKLDLPPTLTARDVRNQIRLAEGKPFTRRRCRRTVHDLFLRGDVANAVIKASLNDDDTVFVKIRIEPLLSYRDFFVTGNRKFNEDDVRRILRFERGREYRESDRQAFVDRLADAYREIGYAAETSDFTFRADEQESKVDVFLTIREGRRYTMRFMNLTGEYGLPVQTIYRKLGWRLNRTARTDKVEDGVKNLARYFRKKGYLEAKVGDPEFVYNDRTRQLDVNLHVESGKRVVVEYDPKVFTHFERTWILDGALELDKQRKVNRWVVRDLTRKMDVYLKKRGYLNGEVLVEFDENYVDPKTDREVKRVYFSAVTGARWRIDEIRFEGASFFSQRQLRSILASSSHYQSDQFLKDLTYVVSEYNKAGFLSVEIRGVEVERDEADHRLNVRVRIEEGPQTIIDRIEFEGATVFDAARLLKEVEIKARTPLNPFAIRGAVTRLSDLYSKNGYIRATVDRRIDFGDDRRSATLVFVIDEGSQFFFGNVYLKGNRLTKDHVIKRELLIREGEPYNPANVFRSEQSVSRLGFFRSVRITPVTTAYDDARIDLIVRVVERNSGFGSVGLGYNTVDGYEATIELGHRNLAGHGRRVSLNTRVTFLNQDIAEFFYPDDYRVAINFLWPWVARIPLDGKLLVVDEKRDDTLFDAVEFSFSPGVETYLDRLFFFLRSTRDLDWLIGLSRFFQTGLSYTWSQSYITNLDSQAAAEEDIDQGELLIAYVSPFVVRDSRDDTFDATTGSVNRIGAEWASPYLGSSADYIKLMGDTSWYVQFQRLGKPRTRSNVAQMLLRSVFAVNVSAGWAMPLGNDTSLPINKRYFLGGINTLRGYNPTQVGPRGGSKNEAVGGNFMAHVNTDVRLRFPYNLGLLLFFDMGNVYAEANTFTFGDVRYSAGLGLRYHTPIGPISADYGFALTRWPDTDFGQFYVSIGNAF